ncbi:hypothetical protein C8R45DRAFT_1099365 [Mycena sanguinolenta]|nr:hypothetical protein C8R45DRAFT_1099365 [Mycena sanguinolenta]
MRKTGQGSDLYVGAARRSNELADVPHAITQYDPNFPLTVSSFTGAPAPAPAPAPVTISVVVEPASDSGASVVGSAEPYKSQKLDAALCVQAWSQKTSAWT